MSAQDSPDTIVLIHGFWVTPRSWEDWIAHYEKKGLTVLAPAYPGFEVEVEALNADPTPIEQVTVAQIMERLEGVVGGLERPPILIGPLGWRRVHPVADGPRLRGGRRGDQFGADRRCQAGAAVAGQSDVPGAEEPGQPAQGGGLHLRAVAVRLHQHVQPRSAAAQLYERYHIPASGQIFWASALANIHPGKDDTHVNYKNPDRAPLLFISGSDDHLMPPSIQQSNAKHYKAEGTITEVKEFTGPHLLPSIDGWEAVADYALDWALNHATSSSSDPA